MKDSLVYCRLHFETLIQGDFPTHFNHTDVASNKGLGSTGPLGLSYYNGVNTVQKGRPRKRKSPGPGADLAAYNAGESIIGVLLLLVNCYSFIHCILFIFIWHEVHADFLYDVAQLCTRARSSLMPTVISGNFQVYKTFWGALPNEIVSEQDKGRNLANCMMMNLQKQLGLLQ